MSHEDIKNMKSKTFLKTYCPHCHQSFIKDTKGEKWAKFKSSIKQNDLEVEISPYLEASDRKFSIPVKDGDQLEDLICPKCNKSLISEESKCEECGSAIGQMLVSADSKLIPFSLCTKAGCQWNGLSKADIRKITPKIKRQEMPEQDPKMRVHNFDEVPYGYTTETAMLEAERCLQCKNPKCVDGCPVNIDIPSFIALISEEKFDEAAKKIKETNVLPAVCGRVCPQESQCEELCIVGVKEEPVAIGRLERFVADYERKMDLVSMPHIGSKTNKKIAVVGSGPGGLTVAADMQLLGYNVTMFEALHEAGGVLTYGIPEFRLPKSIVNFEIDYLKKMGVRLELNHVIGQTLTVDELLENFDGIFIGVGAGLPWFMDLEGEYLGNVFSSNEYLTRMNLMKAYKFPEYDTPKPIGNKVAVIGGGNVAMDCARTAIRTGAKEVTIVYRRSRTELPARIEEIHHAEEEGINFKLLTSPIRYFGNDRAAVKAMECIQMELGEPDSSGRRRPVPLENSNFTMDIDMVIVAVGTGPNPVIFQTTPNLKRDKRGYIVVNEETMETSIPNVYAGGDIVTGSATVIEAMGAGRIAARAMHQKLSGAATKTKEEVVGVS